MFSTDHKIELSVHYNYKLRETALLSVLQFDFVACCQYSNFIPIFCKDLNKQSILVLRYLVGYWQDGLAFSIMLTSNSLYCPPTFGSKLQI